MKKMICKKIFLMAIAGLTILLTACSLDEYEREKPFTICPAYEARLTGCAITEKGDSVIVFTEADIEWFDVNTRELRFYEVAEDPLYKHLKPYHEIVFSLDGQKLFVVSSFVMLTDSRVYEDLVLCYGNQETCEVDGRYYLNDCYPIQFLETETVKANRMKKAAQWELFINYLDKIGKLKK